MSFTALLINGPLLPYTVIDSALEWSRKYNTALKAIIIYSDQYEAEAYSFPSDIESVENAVSEEEGEMNLDKLIMRNLAYIERQAVYQHVTVSGDIYKNPTEDQVLNALLGAAVLFIQPDGFTGLKEYAKMNWTIEEFRLLIPEDIREI
jgi:hypothetical protein